MRPRSVRMAHRWLLLGWLACWPRWWCLLGGLLCGDQLLSAAPEHVDVAVDDLAVDPDPRLPLRGAGAGERRAVALLVPRLRLGLELCLAGPYLPALTG